MTMPYAARAIAACSPRSRPDEKPLSAVGSKPPKPYFEKRSVLRDPKYATDVRSRLKPEKWKSFESCAPYVRYVSLPGSYSGLAGSPHGSHRVRLFQPKRAVNAYPPTSQMACACARSTQWFDGITKSGAVSSATAKSRCVN